MAPSRMLLVIPPEDRPTVTARDVATFLGINERTVRNYMASGLIRSAKVGSLRRTTERWLKEYVESLAVARDGNDTLRDRQERFAQTRGA